MHYGKTDKQTHKEKFLDKIGNRSLSLRYNDILVYIYISPYFPFHDPTKQNILNYNRFLYSCSSENVATMCPKWTICASIACCSLLLLLSFFGLICQFGYGVCVVLNSGLSLEEVGLNQQEVD